MSVENILKDFKWVHLNDERDSLKTGSYSFQLSALDYKHEVKDKMDFNLEIEELTLEFKVDKEKDYLKIEIVGSFGLESHDEHIPPYDIYNEESTLFLKDLKEFLGEKYIVDLDVNRSTKSVEISGNLFDKEKMAITDFDYIHASDEEEHLEDRAMTKKEVFDFINKCGGEVITYIKNGVGGGNPQFVVCLPKSLDSREFFMNLYKLGEEDMLGGNFEDVF